MIPRLLLAFAILGSIALPARAADPFYLERLEQGKAAAARGDLDEARVDLEIACFGLLDEPTLLMEGLVHRALVADGLGQTGRVADILGRILFVEQRFAPYASADLDDVRPQFEDLVYRREELARAIELAAFAHLGERRFDERLAAAGPDQRRTILLERLAATPANAVYLRQLADLETSAGEHRAALPYLEQLLEQQPGNVELRCRRFEAQAHVELCEQALAETSVCLENAADPTIAIEMLDCLNDLGLWSEASAYVEILPVSTRSISRLRKLERRTAQGLKTQQRQAVSESSRAATASAEQQPPMSTPPVSEPPPDPCQAFRQAARQKDCAGILADIATCQVEAQQVQVARPALLCLAEAGEWQQAADLLGVLPPQVRSNGKVRKLERRVSKGLAGAPAAGTGTGTTRPADTRPAETAAGILPPPPPSDAELEAKQSSADTAALESSIDTIRQSLKSARTSTQLTKALADSARLARQHPDLPAAQFLAAEAAYRSGQWEAAVLFFEGGGDLGDDQPLLLFYRAIALFETGDFSAAADNLERALPRLRRTAFVDTYTSRIRSAAAN